MIGASVALALTVFSQHPLRQASEPIPGAPPLPPVEGRCVSIAPHAVPGRSDGPVIVPTLTAAPGKVVFHGLVQNAVLQGGATSSKVPSGYLYVRLDRGQPIYLGFFPGGDPRGTQVYVGIPGVGLGHHALDFAFVEPDSTPFSYGRFCFAVRQGVELNYSLP